MSLESFVPGTEPELRAIDADTIAQRIEVRAEGLGGLLDTIERFVRRFVMFTNEHQSAAVALWLLHVYAIDAASTTPYLRVRSAAPESGKSRLIEALWVLLGDERSILATSLTSATMYRSRAELPIAFLIDEAENTLVKRRDDAGRELLAIVNAGYRRGVTVPRMEPAGRGFVLRRFPTFGPCVIAGLGRLADTAESRCIPIVLDRAPRGSVEDFMLQLVEPAAAGLRAELTDWASPEVIEALREVRPDLRELSDLRDRVREVWWPLIVLADWAGGSWPARARAAADALHGAHAEAETSFVILLLEHIRSAFNERDTDRMPTAELLSVLVANEEGPWGRWWGAEVGRGDQPRAAATDLAAKLRPFGVRPVVVRMPDGRTPRGYRRDDFERVWSTYLPLTPATDATPATPLASTVAPVAGVAGVRGKGEPPQACLECGGTYGHTVTCSSSALAGEGA